jgi:MoaA/NifB/PqqE/SkfB family radical SAM enzyme
MNVRFSIPAFKRKFGGLVVRLNSLAIVLKSYPNPLKARKAIRLLREKRDSFTGTPGTAKFFYANNRFFFNPNVPGCPSLSYNKFITNELNNLLSIKDVHSRLTTSIFSVTRKCPLRCRHCFEWERLDDSESLSIDNLKLILKKLQGYGVSQIQIGGGEPMVRFRDLITLIECAEKGTDFWLLTSGYNLSYEKALQLKKAGLTGVRISLDHWDPGKHNDFRGNQKAFAWATDAARNSRKAGLAMGLAVCLLKENLSEDFLHSYLQFAKSLKASFIMLLEPRETGHFKDEDVRLTEESMKFLDGFYLKVNSEPEFEKYPAVVFPGYHQRRIGCFGAGIRYFYIDSEGSAHACPFCQEKMGNCLEEDLKDIISRIRQRGCFIYSTPKPANIFERSLSVR